MYNAHKHDSNAVNSTSQCITRNASNTHTSANETYNIRLEFQPAYGRFDYNDDASL